MMPIAVPVSRAARALVLFLSAAALAAPTQAFATDGDAPRPSPLAPELETALSRLCAHLGVSPDELAPPRPWPPSELRLDPVTRALHGPEPALEQAASLIRLADQAEEFRDPSELAFLLGSLAGGWLGVPLREGLDLVPGEDAAAQLRAMGRELVRWDAAAPGLSEEWKAALAQLVVDLARTRELLGEALSGLDAAARADLDAAWEDIAGGAPPADALTLGARLLASDRVDRTALARAASAALVSVDAFLQLRPAGEPAVGWRSDVPGIDGLALGPFETPAGTVYLGGPGPNGWRVPPGILIDVAGRDRYEGRPGRPAADGDPVLSLVLDLAGDDVYADGRPGSLGGTRFGLALLRDLGGDDLYDGSRLTQGAAWVGAGLLIDDSGDDLYRAERWAQGAAGIGIGLLVDGGGADTYVASSRAQGYATTLGAGVIADAEGDDSYRLVSEPAVPGAPGGGEGERGQGAAEGHAGAEIAGGVGVLWDASGADTYRAGGRAQGYGDWYAAGWLVDGDGDDGYGVDGTGQGHGRRFGVGALIDLRGHDVRTARRGPAQGSAADRGVGLLFDGAGNDTASSGGPGLGHAASQGTALHLDGSGDDLYLHARGAGALGHGDRSGGAGAWGLFVDAGGADRYASPRAADARLWTSGTWGGGIDRGKPASRAAPERGAGLAEEEPSSDAGVDLPEGVTRISARERLSHPDPAERAAAARVLGVLGNADDAAALVRSAREDSSAWVRGAASLALTEVGRAAAGPAIVEGLEPCARRDAAPRRCQWLVRAAAALIEGEEEPPEGSSALRERLERIATLGPKETGALIMELVFDVQLEP